VDEYDEIVCLEGPLERVNGELALMIPLEEGGDKLREVAQKISEIVEGNILKIVIKPWLAGAAINTDRNLRLQYVAGFGLNLYRANEIYRSMVAYGPRMPKDMFLGSPASLDALARLIERGRFR